MRKRFAAVFLLLVGLFTCRCQAPRTIPDWIKRSDQYAEKLIDIEKKHNSLRQDVEVALGARFEQKKYQQFSAGAGSPSAGVASQGRDEAVCVVAKGQLTVHRAAG